MRLLVKKIFNKILIISMITILMSFFCVNSVSEAKLKLEEGQFYYTGTQEAQVIKIKGEGFWGKILGFIGDLALFLIGALALAFRGVFIGWIEIFEIILTVLLQGSADFSSMFINNDSTVAYKQEVVNIESIIFNTEKIPILDVNIFK